MNTVRIILLLLIFVASINIEILGQPYHCSTAFEIRYGLIILPVEINGETFDFLFDTGAPTSISEKLQEKFAFPVEKIKKQTDSDGNSKRIKYVKVDEFKIAGLHFRNHQASVHDYTANPAIGCLEIDGIIGSNSMHLSTWIIDYQNQDMTITDAPLDYNKDTDYRYRTDGQKSLLINMKTPHSTLKNLKVDYGSVGGLSVPFKIFKVLKDRNEFHNVLVTEGYKMSGLFGEKSKMNVYSGIIPSSKIGNVPLDSFELKTGSKGLLGTKILRDYKVSIDGVHKIMRLELYDNRESDSFETYGFGIGLEENKIIVLNTLKGSLADLLNISPGMEIKKFGNIVFDNPSKLCDYMFSKTDIQDTIQIEILDPDNGLLRVPIFKSNYYK